MPRSRKGLALHPTFKNKQVLRLDCRYCGNCVCTRGMRAILLADVGVELYSTDLPPTESVDHVAVMYNTEKCHCTIKDIACLKCGNIVGYSVISPCKLCLQSCNNGHFYMFHSWAVNVSDRFNTLGTKRLLWGSLLEQDDEDEDVAEDDCLR